MKKWSREHLSRLHQAEFKKICEVEDSWYEIIQSDNNKWKSEAYVNYGIPLKETTYAHYWSLRGEEKEKEGIKVI